MGAAAYIVRAQSLQPPHSLLAAAAVGAAGEAAGEAAGKTAVKAAGEAAAGEAVVVVRRTAGLCGLCQSRGSSHFGAAG